MSLMIFSTMVEILRLGVDAFTMISNSWEASEHCWTSKECWSFLLVSLYLNYSVNTIILMN